MEQKNENEFLMLKNYCNFLIDLGLNVNFFQDKNINKKYSKIEKNLQSVKNLDNYIEDWQIRNDLQLILRNNNTSSKTILLLSEKNNSTNFGQFKNNQPEMLEKMFIAIEQNLDDFFDI